MVVARHGRRRAQRPVALSGYRRSVALADRIGLEPADSFQTYYAALLTHTGCTADGLSDEARASVTSAAGSALERFAGPGGYVVPGVALCRGELMAAFHGVAHTSVSGTPLAYRERGGGVPAVFVHGTGDPRLSASGR